MQPSALRCLIVEDSETDRLMMERVLGKQSVPIDLRFACSLDEARRMMRGDEIEMVFLDNTLPDGRGADFLSELKEYRDTTRLSVVLVSDWPSPFMFAKARAMNVRAIWEKRDFTPGAVGRILRERAAKNAAYVA